MTNQPINAQPVGMAKQELDNLRHEFTDWLGGPGKDMSGVELAHTANTWLEHKAWATLERSPNAMMMIEKFVQTSVKNSCGLAVANLLQGRPDKAGNRSRIAFSADMDIVKFEGGSMADATCVAAPTLWLLPPRFGHSRPVHPYSLQEPACSGIQRTHCLSSSR